MKKALDFIIKSMNGMAYGLFSTLIIGTIIGTIANFFEEGVIYAVLNSLSTLLKNLTGVGIGIGIAWSLKIDGLKMICSAVSGGITSYFTNVSFYDFFRVVDYDYFVEKAKFQIGDPLKKS